MQKNNINTHIEEMGYERVPCVRLDQSTVYEGLPVLKVLINFRFT